MPVKNILLLGYPYAERSFGRGFVKQLNRPMVTIIGRFLCDVLAQQRPGLLCVKGAVSEADRGIDTL